MQSFHGDQEPRKTPENQENAECKRKGQKKKLLGRVPMQSPDIEEARPAVVRDIPDQGCKSLLENNNNSVGYSYIVGQGFGKLHSATNLAPTKLPEVAPHASAGLQSLRSLLSMEYRLSDLQFDGVHTWLRHRTNTPVNRESA